MAFEKNPDEIGALWVKTSAKGDYMTGHVTIDGVETRIVCFARDKRSEKSPAWTILKSKPRDSAGASYQPEPVDDSSIPF